MTLNATQSFRSKAAGVSLVEILVCIALFSTAIVAIYMGTTDSERAVAKGMKADVEAAIANMKIAEVNPFDPDVDTAFDAPATYTTGKQSYTLPNGQIIYWTRAVTSNNASGDVKQVNVYLYRNSSDSTPYRKFRKDMVLERQSYMLADSSSIPKFYKDPTGTVWARLANSTNSIISSGSSHRPGPDSAGNNTYSPVAVDTATATNLPTYDGATAIDQMWTYGHTSHASYPGHLVYTFPATQNQTYTVKLGLCECGSAVPPTGAGTAAANGQRNIKIYINGTLAETSAVDVYALTGGTNKAIVKQYHATAMDLGSSVYGIKVDLDQNSSTLKPLLMNVQIERNTGQ